MIYRDPRAPIRLPFSFVYLILGHGGSFWFAGAQIRNQQVGGSNPLAGSRVNQIPSTDYEQ
jgi:hypothetical protein